MARAELGTKRVCPETGKKFYDLNKDPIVSPFTGKEYPRSFFEETAPVTVGKETAGAKSAKSEKKEPENEVEEEAEDEESGPEFVSLEDAEDDTDDEEDEDEEAIPDLPDVEIEVDDDDDSDDDTFLEDDEEDDDLSDVIGGVDGEEEA